MDEIVQSFKKYQRHINEYESIKVYPQSAYHRFRTEDPIKRSDRRRNFLYGSCRIQLQLVWVGLGRTFLVPVLCCPVAHALLLWSPWPTFSVFLSVRFVRQVIFSSNSSGIS